MGISKVENLKLVFEFLLKNIPDVFHINHFNHFTYNWGLSNAENVKFVFEFYKKNFPHLEIFSKHNLGFTISYNTFNRFHLEQFFVSKKETLEYVFEYIIENNPKILTNNEKYFLKAESLFQYFKYKDPKTLDFVLNFYLKNFPIVFDFRKTNDETILFDWFKCDFENQKVVFNFFHNNFPEHFTKVDKNGNTAFHILSKTPLFIETIMNCIVFLRKRYFHIFSIKNNNDEKILDLWNEEIKNFQHIKYLRYFYEVNSEIKNPGSESWHINRFDKIFD